MTVGKSFLAVLVRVILSALGVLFLLGLLLYSCHRQERWIP